MSVQRGSALCDSALNAAGLEGDILQLSGFLLPGFGFAGSEIDIIRFRRELRKPRRFDRVGALQPKVEPKVISAILRTGSRSGRPTRP
jgi:hypothetical protein